MQVSQLVAFQLYWMTTPPDFLKTMVSIWKAQGWREKRTLYFKCILKWPCLLNVPGRSIEISLFSFISLSNVCSYIQKLTRVRVVDNSALGNTPYHRPPKCIHVYTKNGVGKVGDQILLAIKGEKKKALIVGCKFPGPRMSPRFDSNNVVLIEDNGNPVGTRIKTSIPSLLRKKREFSKVLAIATDFVWSPGETLCDKQRDVVGLSLELRFSFLSQNRGRSVWKKEGRR